MRTMTTRGLVTSVIVFGVLAWGLRNVSAQQASGGGSKTASAQKNSVREITVPEYPQELPPGPNLATFQKQCLLCHSARYVTMQPHFSRTVWEKEVKKMVDAYGAQIPASEQQQIVEYLVEIRGPAGGK